MTTDPTAQPTPTPALVGATAAADLTDEQIDADLLLEGFNMREKYPEYGQDALRKAYRAGVESEQIAHARQSAPEPIQAPTPAPVAVPERSKEFARAAEALRSDAPLDDQVRAAVAKWLEAVAVTWAGTEQHYDCDDEPIEFEATVDSIAQEVADAVLAPRPEPVTAPLPSEAVALLPAVERFPNPKTDVDRLAILLMTTWERVEGPVGTSYVANFADMARAVLAAGYTRPAAGQRARDEGAVRRAVLDAIEDPGRDDENPASRERIAGWRACARDVREALDSVEDDDEGTVRVPREAVERLRRAHEGYIPDTCADAGLDRAAGAVLDGSR